MDLTVVLSPAEEGGYSAFNPETGTTSQGEAVDEAVANLREATILYLAEFPIESLQATSISDFESAWKIEIQKRVTAFKQENTQVFSAEEVFSDARRLFI